MKCPHCTVSFHDKVQSTSLPSDRDGEWFLLSMTCSSCHRLVFHLKRVYSEEVPSPAAEGGTINERLTETIQVRPKGSARPPCPQEVDHNEIKEDYEDACLVFSDSAKASAALSRRCLQNVLREKAKVKPGNLSDEIQAVIDAGQLPSHLIDSIDSIRNIGNFGAHPIKSTSTGQILPVEPGEAEWNLDVIEDLLDFYFVRPAKVAAKRTALNKKLQEAGKPPMK